MAADAATCVGGLKCKRDGHIKSGIFAGMSLSVFKCVIADGICEFCCGL